MSFSSAFFVFLLVLAKCGAESLPKEGTVEVQGSQVVFEIPFYFQEELWEFKTENGELKFFIKANGSPSYSSLTNFTADAYDFTALNLDQATSYITLNRSTEPDNSPWFLLVINTLPDAPSFFNSQVSEATSKTCPNDCSGKGVCERRICFCQPDFIDRDCGIYSPMLAKNKEIENQEPGLTFYQFFVYYDTQTGLLASQEGYPTRQGPSTAPELAIEYKKLVIEIQSLDDEPQIVYFLPDNNRDVYLPSANYAQFKKTIVPEWSQEDWQMFYVPGFYLEKDKVTRVIFSVEKKCRIKIVELDKEAEIYQKEVKSTIIYESFGRDTTYDYDDEDLDDAEYDSSARTVVFTVLTLVCVVICCCCIPTGICCYAFRKYKNEGSFFWFLKSKKKDKYAHSRPFGNSKGKMRRSFDEDRVSEHKNSRKNSDEENKRSKKGKKSFKKKEGKTGRFGNLEMIDQDQDQDANENNNMDHLNNLPPPIIGSMEFPSEIRDQMVPAASRNFGGLPPIPAAHQHVSQSKNIDYPLEKSQSVNSFPLQPSSNAFQKNRRANQNDFNIFSNVEEIQSSKNGSCPFCSKKFLGKKRVSQHSRCGTVFHLKCLEQWQQEKVDLHLKCPKCFKR